LAPPPPSLGGRSTGGRGVILLLGLCVGFGLSVGYIIEDVGAGLFTTGTGITQGGGESTEGDILEYLILFNSKADLTSKSDLIIGAVG
jgi:hypothetical protein